MPLEIEVTKIGPQSGRILGTTEFDVDWELLYGYRDTDCEAVIKGVVQDHFWKELRGLYPTVKRLIVIANGVRDNRQKLRIVFIG